MDFLSESMLAHAQVSRQGKRSPYLPYMSYRYIHMALVVPQRLRLGYQRMQLRRVHRERDYLIAALILEEQRQARQQRRRRTMWVKPWLLRRVTLGHYDKKSIVVHKTLGQPHGKRKATVRPTYGRRGTALRHGYGVSNCYGDRRNEKEL